MKYLIDNITEHSEEFYVVVFNSLDQETQTLIQKKKKSENKKESLLSLYLLKKGLKEFFGIEDYKVLRTEKGKPYLMDNSVYFSVSHSNGTVAVAFSEFPVGIDIEYTRKYSAAIAEKIFQGAEKEYAKESDLNFTRIWTLKEAIVKAQGTGIAYSKSINFKFSQDKIFVNISGAEIFHIKENDLVISVCEIK